MKLYSVCPTCDAPDWSAPYVETRIFGDFDKCPKCGGVMDIWTESGIRNEMTRRQWGIAITQSKCICHEQHRRGYCTEPGCPHRGVSLSNGERDRG